jgi:hypothetical protein
MCVRIKGQIGILPTGLEFYLSHMQIVFFHQHTWPDAGTCPAVFKTGKVAFSWDNAD